MVQYEMVLELREFLSEHVYTCFFTNYYFEHHGVRLNDYMELSELNLEEDPKIFMRPEKYDEKNARAHIKRVKEILSSPQLLSSTPSTAASNLPSSIPKGEEGEESKSGEASSTQNAYEEKLKKSYEDFMSIVERESKKEIPMPPNNKAAQ
jgi:hypothetical protein